MMDELCCSRQCVDDGVLTHCLRVFVGQSDDYAVQMVTWAQFNRVRQLHAAENILDILS